MNDYFTDIRPRIIANISETKTSKTRDEYGRKPIGDFIPYAKG